MVLFLFSESCFVDNINYVGKDLPMSADFFTLNAGQCQERCRLIVGCKAFTYHKKYHFCWFKHSIGDQRENDNLISGPDVCREENGEPLRYNKQSNFFVVLCGPQIYNQLSQNIQMNSIVWTFVLNCCSSVA